MTHLKEIKSQLNNAKFKSKGSNEARRKLLEEIDKEEMEEEKEKKKK